MQVLTQLHFVNNVGGPAISPTRGWFVSFSIISILVSTKRPSNYLVKTTVCNVSFCITSILVRTKRPSNYLVAKDDSLKCELHHFKSLE